VVEGLGNRLGAFWKLQGRASDFLVLETVLEEAVHYRPMSGEKNRVVFREGADANN
jgi:hypothetical protein